MSYAIIANDIVEVDKLISKIKLYKNTFIRHEEDFIHYKNVERFESNLERNVPRLRHHLSQIYSSGRNVAMSVHDAINKHLDYNSCPLLKTAIDDLEPYLLDLKQYGIDEREKINKIYTQCGYNEWSINQMLDKIAIMCRQIDEILILIGLIKTSYTYQVQSEKITAQEAQERSKTTMTTNNFSGDISQSIVSTGNHSTNTLTINSNNERLRGICQQLIEVINQTATIDADKDAVKAAVQAIESAKDQSSLKNAYHSLLASISDHTTIGTAILNSKILPALGIAIM